MAERRRPRVLLVTRNLPPLVGGMERLNWHLADELAKVADVRVVGPEGSAAPAPRAVVVREATLKPLWKFLLHARGLARREARRWKADIVLAGSGLTAPLARSAARTCGARAVVYVHGLDVAVTHPVYRVVWLPALRRMDRVIANSRATAALCRDVGVDPARIGIVHPGVDLPAGRLQAGSYEKQAGSPEGFRMSAPARDGRLQAGSYEEQAGSPEGFRRSAPARSARSFFSRDHAPGGGPVLLSVGRLSARKGLREFVTQALPRIVAVHPGAVLRIVGDAPGQALHARAQTPDSIQAAADAAGVGRSLRFLGVITDYRELGEAYRAADVHVFPVREIPGDPEGFGMVAVEAAAHGLPTVAFATGGVVDAVAEGESGHLVPPGDYAAFAAAVLRVLDAHDAMRATCVTFAQAFAWPAFGAQIARQLCLRDAGQERGP